MTQIARIRKSFMMLLVALLGASYASSAISLELTATVVPHKSPKGGGPPPCIGDCDKFGNSVVNAAGWRPVPGSGWTDPIVKEVKALPEGSRVHFTVKKDRGLPVKAAMEDAAVVVRELRAALLADGVSAKQFSIAIR